MSTYEQEKERLREWLQRPERRKLINLSGIEQRSGVPASTLKNWLNGRNIEPKHVQAVVTLLSTWLGYPSPHNPY
ncbi:hypothetical protein SAMN05421823_11949 [Catalinimonas alkaloidigena]|uniref:Helix-turn-helix n=1 Tax=Catalinimonas alkaloidigena TaxID=1075417 RepID=A0A1G9V871_9BACT|nr:hypothetical protein [Catalinimonas alkaloidigena]SDM68412.1 hypothetical protein SAMN05421823_11949 [Catalinimonas alkaloidigena]